MAVDKSQEPYFDDFDPDKNYYQVLFVPGRAVQTREMNQIQSMIQNQIENIGDHTFQNGSLVIPGEINYNFELDYVTLNMTDYESYKEALSGVDVTVESSSGLEATLDGIVEADATDPLTFFVTYYQTASDNVQKVFADGETVTIKNNLGNTITTADVITTGKGSKVTISEGVFYVNGYFVKVDTQDIILDKYGQSPSYKVGFEAVESTVDSNTDVSLLDNASGTPNFTAPGADRLKIELNVVKKTLEEDVGTEFVELIRFDNGELQKKVRGPDYSVLGTTLAERTFDESGDYSVDAFQVTLAENDTDNTVFNAEIEGGRAYVKGYQVENLGTTVVEVDKALTTEIVNNTAFSANIGYYIEIDSSAITNIPNIGDINKITFYDGVDGTGNTLGTAYVRSYTRQNASYDNLYIFNVRNNSGIQDSSFISNAVSVNGAGTYPFTANIYNPGGGYEVAIRDALNYAPIFRLPYENVKTLLDTGVTDTTFSVIKQVEGTTDSSGNFTYNAGTNEIFPTQNSAYSLLSVTSAGFEEVIDYSGSYTLGGTPTGKSITISLGAGYESKTVRVNILTVNQIAVQKTKTPTQTNITGSLTSGVLSLGKSDVYNIVSIVDASLNDITDWFDLYHNKKTAYYDISYVQLKPGYSVSGNITVTFDYFSHGAGNYFSVDSYSSIPYEDIPTEIIEGVEVKLSDVLDFRPRIDDTGTDFVGAGSSITNIPVPNSIIRADIEHYLPRVDKLYVDYQGSFGAVKGIPSADPQEPNTPDNAMALYILNIPPYTNNIDEVEAIMIDNTRYTMRDIGKLEERIKNVEYYTTLNLLEQETSNLQIVDAATGLNRFKNGFVTDSFVDHRVGNFDSPLYKCSVSEEESKLRPEFHNDAVDLEINETDSSNVTVHENLITLPYTHNALITQDKASSWINVNPYAVKAWIGKLKLSPSSDTWYDSRYTRPTVNYRLFNNGRLTQRWSSWRLNWSGGRTVSRRTTSRTTRSWLFDVTRRTTTTTTTNTNIRKVADRVIRTDVIPYMRNRNISFTGKGFRPFAKLYPFFDDVDVSAYCTPSNPIADAAGNVSGTFNLPNNKFKTGTKDFKLIDTVDGSDTDATSSGEAEYSARGILLTRKQTILATRSVRTSSRTRTTVGRIRWRDPIAQSFLIDQEGGVFLTKIDVFFREKDKHLPVTIEIRDMVNGYPGPNIVPYSEVLLTPSEVNTSTDASVATTFTFDDPVYLEEGSEYCFVIKSNSTDYLVYVAGQGENEIGANRAISKQPYVGVMFKSQNNTTWTEDQTKDIKFNIYNAQFNTGVTGNAVLENSVRDDVILNNNPITTTSASGIVEVEAINHGLFPGSYVTISNAQTVNGILDTELNTTHTVTDVTGQDTFTITTVGTATETGRGGGNSVQVTTNMIYDVFNPNIQTLNFTGTSIDYTLTGRTGKSLSGSETPYLSETFGDNLIISEDHYLYNPYVVLSDVEEANQIAGAKSLRVVGQFTSTNANISPVIDMNRMSVVGVNNIINSPDPIEETTFGEGNVLARYITRNVVLDESANSLRVYADVNKPQGSEVYFYYRIASSDNEISETDWTLMDTVKTQSPVDDNQFYENEYEKESLNPFTYFQIKIVMVSTSSSRVPELRNFRGIALGT